MRLYETQCKECTAYAVLNGYCRECGFDINTEDNNATDKQTDTERTDNETSESSESDRIITVTSN